MTNYSRLIVKPITASDLRPFLDIAKQEDLYFAKNTDYFGVFLKGELIGFGGILWYRNKAVFKNYFVLPSHRGNGLFRKMFDYSIAAAKNRGLSLVEATCTNMSINLFMQHGAVVVYQFKKFKKVEMEI